MIENWNGFFKYILYILDFYYDELIKKDTNDTLAFINDLKNSQMLQKIESKIPFKNFVAKIDLRD